MYDELPSDKVQRSGRKNVRFHWKGIKSMIRGEKIVNVGGPRVRRFSFGYVHNVKVGKKDNEEKKKKKRRDVPTKWKAM